MMPKIVSFDGAALHAGTFWTVVLPGEPISIDAGDRALHGSYSPELNMVLEGLMYHPPYLFGASTLGLGGRPSGKVSSHCDWKRSSDMKRDSIV